MKKNSIIAQLTAATTALGSVHFVWTADAQARFDALKLALSSAPVFGELGPTRPAERSSDPDADG